MSRWHAVLVLGVLLIGCTDNGVGTGPRDWSGGGPGSVRWGGADSGGYGPSGGGYWRGRNYGYRDDYRRPPYERGYGGRTFRPSGNVLCDRATETCYQGREIDASQTREYFGNQAARRVDRIRDNAGTNRIFRPEDDVVCNRRTRACREDGRFDQSETRDFFGRKAARRLDKARANP